MKTSIAAIAVLAALTLGAPADAASCSNQKVTSSAKADILAAHKGKATFVKGSLFYGKCGSTYYAAATFTAKGVGTTDQPESFKKSGGTWKDLGDGGCDPSNHQIPSSLKKIWKLCS